MGRARSRSRGEGNTEYLILLLFVVICAVVGLFSSYSNTIKKIQLEKGLCIDCTQKEKVTPKPDATKPTDPPKPDLSKSTAMSDSDSWWASFRSFLGWW